MLAMRNPIELMDSARLYVVYLDPDRCGSSFLCARTPPPRLPIPRSRNRAGPNTAGSSRSIEPIAPAMSVEHSCNRLLESEACPSRHRVLVTLIVLSTKISVSYRMPKRRQATRMLSRRICGGKSSVLPGSSSRIQSIIVRLDAGSSLNLALTVPAFIYTHHTHKPVHRQIMETKKSGRTRLINPAARSPVVRAKLSPQPV